jgi:hypothetical protein
MKGQRLIIQNNGGVSKNPLKENKKDGFSVRLIKD